MYMLNLFFHVENMLFGFLNTLVTNTRETIQKWVTKVKD